MTANFPIRKLVIHSSATKPSQVVNAAIIDRWHRRRGFNQIGYHFVILRDGMCEGGRHIRTIGAHAKGHNKGSIGICLVGGLNESTSKPENNYTEAQMETLASLLETLELLFKQATTLGHRDLSPDLNHNGIIESNEWTKACPCFDVTTWWSQTKHKRYLA